jgi:hypothetical protein
MDAIILPLHGSLPPEMQAGLFFYYYYFLFLYENMMKILPFPAFKVFASLVMF